MVADSQLTGTGILGIVVGGGIVAIIGVIVGASADGITNTVQRLRTRYRIWRIGDHTAIDSGHGVGTDHGGRRHYCLTIKIAPSQSLRHGFELDIDAVDRWVTSTFGASELVVNVSNPRELIRYQAADGQPGEVPMVTIYPTGLVEYLQPLNHTVTGDGENILDIVTIARYIYHVASAVSNGALQQIYRQPRPSRHRVDWRVSISPNISALVGRGGSTTQMWAGLSFEGRAPDRHAVGQNPPMTRSGYGYLKLKNIPQSTLPPVVVLAVIKAFLEESGYVGLDECLADLSRAVRGLPDHLAHRTQPRPLLWSRDKGRWPSGRRGP